MSLLWEFLVAAALIAGFVLFRMFADRYLARRRIASGAIEHNCAGSTCQRNCSQSATPSSCTAGTTDNLSKRSASHAP